MKPTLPQPNAYSSAAPRHLVRLCSSVAIRGSDGKCGDAFGLAVGLGVHDVRTKLGSRRHC
jgi:hypothetical protein